MPIKYVRDTKAAQSLSAYIILSPTGEHIAQVLAYHGNTCTVNVFNYGPNNVSAESLPFQVGRAGGHGYDKFTAALAGLIINGIELMDHSNKVPESEAGRPDVTHANWSHEEQKWMDYFIRPGLDRLQALGYTVIQAI